MSGHGSALPSAPVAKDASARHPEGKAQRHPRGDERKPAHEPRDVAGRGPCERIERRLAVTRKERARGAGAVEHIEGRGERTWHR